MRQLNEHHSFTGMQRDISISKHPSSFLYDAHNIRLTARGEDTLLTITNEKGTKDVNVEVSGTYLGHCILGNYLVVFSTNPEGENNTNPDYITRIDLTQKEATILYNGDLNFSTIHPIEAIASYENNNIQKVYWTDGYNQPRVINIVGTILEGVDNQFDFIRELALNEEVKVQKQLGAAGSFAPGVIQYALTYYSKYRQESNIFYTSPLIYVSYKDRGGSPEDKVENAFKITVSNFDNTFDYLRIYSIQRTSINGTPIVKRVQDINIKNIGANEVSFLDTGTVGDTVDPTELLFKGGESLIAGTIEQKDNTLFLGNLTLDRPVLDASIKRDIVAGTTIEQDTRTFYPISISDFKYIYSSQLTSFSDSEKTNSVPCGGFKRGDYYRCGVQFQYKNGKWSDPIWIKDEKITNAPSVIEGTSVTVPALKGIITQSVSNRLYNLGYRKARAVIVFPETQDRVTICQGVACPTLYTINHRNDGDVYAQPSWFFRPVYGSSIVEIDDDGSVVPTSEGLLPYTSKSVNANNVPNWNPSKLRQVEIQGHFDINDRFKIDRNFSTLHSPDIEFDDHLSILDFIDTCYRNVGYVNFITTFSDIDIQTETPTISNGGGGFQHKGFVKGGPQGIISGLFYDDYVVDDNGGSGKFRPYIDEKSAYKWFVYAWNRTGSLNNDINRPSDEGTRTATLKKKVISNLRYTTSTLESEGNPIQLTDTPQIFNSDQLSIVKVGNDIYQGNIDTLISPTDTDGMYFAFESDDPKEVDVVTSFRSSTWWKTFNRKDDSPDGQGLWKWNSESLVWDRKLSAVGDKTPSLAVQREHVRMKYKSSPHMVLKASSVSDVSIGPNASALPIIEIIRKGDDNQSFYRSTMFGGTTGDALKANAWIPCGEPVTLGSSYDDTSTEGATKIQYSYGDTYFQRWDCLKTYPFTREDINQIVEIGSFMLETRINIDGRYDRNRGQSSNINMTPQNFNLLNPVYTQVNNFFTYRILDADYYTINSFPNQITWTKEKQAGADVDLWTNVTLASTYDMDGSKGAVVSINTWRDQIFCFQDKGISNILFNSRVQIPTSDGVPIEISNSYKVDGYRYITDGTGCINKWTISDTPSGLYFIDSISNHLYHIGEGIQDITTIHNMTSWFNDIDNNVIVRTLHDNINNDLYIITEKEALCYSEILGQFTSFMDYNGIVLLESNGNYVYTMKNSKLYQMFQGLPNNFFGEQKGWDFSFISNGIDNSLMDFDKIFSNIDYRMDMFNDDIYEPDKTFDYIQVGNEYQDTGEVPLSRLRISTNPKSYHQKGTNLQKKFRIWRIQIPRNRNSLDRIRNTWCKIKLGNRGSDNLRAVLHDLNVQYYL